MGARNCTKRAPIGRKRDGEEGPWHESANLLEPDARIGRPGVGIGPRPRRLPSLALPPESCCFPRVFDEAVARKKEAIIGRYSIEEK